MNQYTYDAIKYKFKRNIDNSIEVPRIFLVSRSLKKKGQIYPIENFNADLKFNEANSVTFTIHQFFNGNRVDCFDDVKNLSVILIEGMGYFQVECPTKETDCVEKNITATALQEEELSQTNITIEVNTDDDLAVRNYVPTVMYDQSKPDNSLLDRVINDAAPHYKIGYVDPSLYDIQKEFSVSDTSVWDFFQQIAEEIGCVFLCDPFSRTINVFDINDHCINTEYHDKKDTDGNYVNDHSKRHIIDGVCTICGEKAEVGYGLDSSIYVDTENLAQEIEDSVDVDQVKNCYKITGGDDTVTNLVQQRLIGNSNYIWCIGQEQLSEMSKDLQTKWASYQELVKSKEKRFEQLWTYYNRLTDTILYWQSGRMPIVEAIPSTEDATAYCKQIYDDIVEKIDYGCVASKNTGIRQLSKDILNYANTLCPTGYAVKYQQDSNGEDKVRVIGNTNPITKWGGYLYVYLKNYPDPDDESKDKHYYSPTSEWQIPVKCGDSSFRLMTVDGKQIYTNDYYLYLKRMLDIQLANADITYEPKYYSDSTEEAKHIYDSDYYKNYFAGICNKCHKHNIVQGKCKDCGSTDVQEGYSINRLSGIAEGYRAATTILTDLDTTIDQNRFYQLIVDNSTTTISPNALFVDLTQKFSTMADYIDSLINEYTRQVDMLTIEQNIAIANINAINSECNLKKYLGDNLYHEFISFKREQTYNNSNFTSETVDESTLMKNVEELIKYAREDIAKSCLFSHTVTIQMSNLLSLVQFKDVFDAFAVGNYIRVRINGQNIKLRIVSLHIDFENLESSEVTFSEATVLTTDAKKIGDAISKASSIASSYDYTQKQVSKNTASSLEFQKMMSDGLSMTQTHIMSSENEEVMMDTHGIIARQYLSDSNTYSDFQSRLNSCGLIFTKDKWLSIDTAVGQIYWNGKLVTGIIAKNLIGEMIIGNNLSITNDSGNYTIDNNGFTMGKGNASIVISPTNPSMVFKDKSKNTIFDFNSNNDGKLKITGDIVANSLTLGSNASIDYDKLIDVPDFVEKGKTIGTYGNGTTGMSISTDGLLRASNAVIYGTIYASNGKFTGTVTSSNGTIAGWTLSSYGFSKDLTSINDTINTGIFLSPSTGLRLNNIDGGGIYVQNEANNRTNTCTLRGNYLDFSNTTNKGDKAIVGCYSSSAPEFAITDTDNTIVTRMNAKGLELSLDSSIYAGGKPLLTRYANNNIYIGATDSRATNCYICADNVYKNTSGGNVSLSDQRFKTDVQSIQQAQDFIMSLKPVKYKYTDGTSDRYHFGFLADDVEQSLQDTTGDAGVFVKYSIDETTTLDLDNPDTYVCGLRYEEIIAPLVQTIQNQQKEIEEIKSELDKLKNMIKK